MASKRIDKAKKQRVRTSKRDHRGSIVMRNEIVYVSPHNLKFDYEMFEASPTLAAS
jgi:hypothetical protein